LSTDALITLIDGLYRQSFGKLLDVLLKSFPDLEFTEAEDILQESFSAALVHWKDKGVPDNPKGWLYQVSRNKTIDWLRDKNRFSGVVQEHHLIAEENTAPDFKISDYTLGMLCACVHPDLAPKTQMIVTLKYVMNLKVEAIARAFAMTIDGIDKILVRGREKIKADNIRLTVPENIQDRLPIIHKIIYLIFNEGYKASYGPELIREELCEEALLLCKELLDSHLGDRNTEALYALMLFNSARLEARFDSQGNIVDLENQNRELWNKDLIALGSHYLFASNKDEASSFHIEASIGWLHCSAPSFESTNWNLIAGLYSRLMKIQHNPFLQLNLAVALFNAGERKKALELAHELAEQHFFSQYYLLNATLGKFYLLEGNKNIAREFLLKAINQTHFDTEKEFIRKMLQRTS
jgi:RNA polymerase sigma-70 factor (ECF subfamily)